MPWKPLPKLFPELWLIWEHFQSYSQYCELWGNISPKLFPELWQLWEHLPKLLTELWTIWTHFPKLFPKSYIILEHFPKLFPLLWIIWEHFPSYSQYSELWGLTSPKLFPELWLISMRSTITPPFSQISYLEDFTSNQLEKYSTHFSEIF